MYNRDEQDDIYNRDHITEAYGPTAADATLFALEDVRAQAAEDGDEETVKELTAEIEALCERWGFRGANENRTSWLYDLI